MKVARMYTIDADLAELLSKESNASTIINSLVRDFYAEKLNTFDAELKELKKRKKEIVKKMRDFKRKEAEKEEKMRKIESQNTPYRKVRAISEEEAQKIKRTGKWD